MPRRNRNKDNAEWARTRHGNVIINHRGVPLKIGDTILGKNSGNVYSLGKTALGSTVCRDHGDSQHKATLNVARQGHLQGVDEESRMASYRAMRK